MVFICPGESVKMEPQEFSVGIAVPSIKVEAPAAGTGPPEKKKKKKRDRDKDGQTDETKLSNAGNGYQTSVKAEMKEEGSHGVRSAGREDSDVKIIVEKDALAKAGGSKKLVAGAHISLPNGHAEHQPRHAGAQGKVKKEKGTVKG